MAAEQPELVVCDTSFIGMSERGQRNPGAVSHWPEAEVARIEAAILAISVISLGEIRAGRIHAGWGAPRVSSQEDRLARLVWIPLDTEIIDEWAELKVNSWQNGWSLPDNDLWIAATASAKELTLVSCDRGFSAVPGLDWIYLPSTPESRPV